MMDESAHNRNPTDTPDEPPETIPTPPPGQTFYELLERRPGAWSHLDEAARLHVAMHGWLLLAGHDFAAGGDSHVMGVLALAWQDRACRGWLLGQQELWARERRENLAARLEALATTGPDTMAPRLESLAAARDEPEPAPVLWRDADGRFADAVLSVGEVALLSGEGGLGKSYVTLALAVAGALAGDLHHEYGAACGLRVTPGPVVLVSYEDSPARMFGRLRRMGNDAAAVRLHTARHPMPLWTADGHRGGASQPAEWWTDLWAYVREVGARLVVIDPASAALADVSPGESGPVRAFLRALTVEAECAAAGVLIVTHSTKAARNAARAGDDPGAGIVSGSAAWYDGARGVLALSELPDNPDARRLEAVKSNYGRKGWAAVLHEATTNGGDFAGLVFLENPGDRIDDMRTPKIEQKKVAGRNGANTPAGEL